MDNKKIAALDWGRIESDLNKEGYALLPKFVTDQEIDGLKQLANNQDKQGQQQSLDALGLGVGNFLRLPNQLPQPLHRCREALFSRLVPIANRWSEIMGKDTRYPPSMTDYARVNQELGQVVEMSFISSMQPGEYHALHQNLVDANTFPLQLVILLSDPTKDFFGGEFIMTEQRPRMQSRPMVLPLRKGDAAIITVAHRPFRGSKGYYRVNIKHAVSRLRSGERMAIELIFHQAP